MNEKFSQFGLETLSAVMSSSDPDAYYLVGHNEVVNQEDNFKISLTDLVVAILASNKKVVNLDGSSTYQDSDFIDKTNVIGFTSGQEINTSNFITNFDSTTGTITINNLYTPFTGEILFIWY